MKIYSDGKVIAIGSGGGGSSEDVYSTEETRIGTWIDGKPLYRKAYSGISPTDMNTWGNVQFVSTDVDAVISFNGSIYDIGDGFLKYIAYLNHVAQGFNKASGYIIMYITAKGLLKQKVVGYIEYTKTTDQATIELPFMLTAQNSDTFLIDTPSLQTAAVTSGNMEIRNDDTKIRNKEV